MTNLILAYQMDPEVSEMNGAHLRFGDAIEDILSVELRLILLFMDSEQTIVMPPTYWLESDVSVRVLLRNVAMIEKGYVRFLMNEGTFEDFRQKKSYRYRQLMHVFRFQHGYGTRGRTALQGVPARVVGKTFSAGKDTFEDFRQNGSGVLHRVLPSGRDVEYFLEKLEDTQRDVFIWESMVEELLSANIDIKKAESAGLRNIMDSTCLLYTSPSPRDKRQSRMPSSA